VGGLKDESRMQMWRFVDVLGKLNLGDRKWTVPGDKVDGRDIDIVWEW
jgi:hypothetical protein